jgi:hypothetical protein
MNAELTPSEQHLAESLKPVQEAVEAARGALVSRAPLWDRVQAALSV